MEDEEEEDSANDTDFADSDTETTNGPLGKLTPRPAGDDIPSITELRAKLAKRIESIQAAKKVDGKTVVIEGETEESAQSREELLETRRKQRGLVRDNRRNKRKAERRAEKPKVTERVASNGKKGGGKANAPPKEPREERDFNDRDEDRPVKKSKVILLSLSLAPRTDCLSSHRQLHQPKKIPNLSPSPPFQLQHQSSSNQNHFHRQPILRNFPSPL